MKRTKEEAQKTREKLLRSAVKVFNTLGYANATLTDIAKEADVTRGAIYHHFGNKDEFIDAIIQANKSRINRLVQEVLSSKTNILDALRRVFSTLMEKLENDDFFKSSEELLLKMQLSGDLSKHRCELNEASQEGFKQLCNAFNEAKSEGLISTERDSQNLALQIISCYIGVFMTWLIHPDKFSPSKDGMDILERIITEISN